MTITSNDKKEIIAEFGFSFEESTDSFSDITALADVSEELRIARLETEHYRSANREIIKRVTRLMNNLKKNPELPMIKWPDRAQEIDRFLKEINEIHTNKVITQVDNGQDNKTD